MSAPMPFRTLKFAALCGILLCLAAFWFMLRQPWLGLELGVQGDGLYAVGVQAGGAAVPPGAQVVGLLPAAGPMLALTATDIVEVPDVLPDYVAVADFFRRQTAIAGLLAAPGTSVVWQTADGQVRSGALPGTSRPLASLPFKFWFLLACALAGATIAAWVAVLRPGETAARLFAVGGAVMFLGCLTDAVYGNRELALDGTVFQWLSGINHLAGLLYGTTIVGLLLVYPRRLAGDRVLAALAGFYFIWWLMDAARLVPGPDWGVGLAILSQLLLASLLAVLQWRASRGEPLQRAALRWFLVAFLGTTWLFVFAVVLPILLGQPILIEQGYADSLLVALYMGVAVGVSRHRLFDLDVWAYRILLVVLGAALVAGLDLLLIWTLHLGPMLSLGWALFLAGWLYFPLRQWLWQRLAGGASASTEAVLPDLIEIAFTVDAVARDRHWTDLLGRAYGPLHQEELDTAPERAEVAEEGLALRLPGCAGLPGRMLRYAAGGTRLFSPVDAESAQGLCDLMTRAEAGRDAYERGASEERGRVYRDLHDDIGAKLLSLAIGAENAARADLARSALNDLRDVVSHGGREPVPLTDLLADWRAEMDGRLAGADLQLIWRQPYDLPDPTVAAGPALHLGRVLRETVSNVLRHAQASCLEVDVTCDGEWLCLGLRDDGRGLPEPLPRRGKGLVSMRSRVEQLGGRIAWQAAAAGGCEVRLEVDCRQLAGMALVPPSSRGSALAGEALP